MKLFITLMAVLFSFNVYSQIKITDVDIKCTGPRCSNVIKSLQRLKGDYENKNHLNRTIDGIVVNSGVSLFSYHVKNNLLSVKLITKPVVDQIELRHDNRFGGDLPESLPVGFGDLWDSSNQIKLKSFLEEYFSTIGYPNSKVIFSTTAEDEYVNIDAEIVVGRPLVLTSINVESNSEDVKGIFIRKMQSLLNRPLNMQKLREEVEDFLTIIKDYGYYAVTMNNKNITNKNEVSLLFEINEGSQFAFDARDTIFFTSKEMKNELKTLASLYKEDLNPETIKAKVSSLYKERGVANPILEVKEEKVKNIWGLPLRIFKINMFELERTRFAGVIFKGNSSFDDDELEVLFKENATELVSNNYYDISYYENFTNILLKKYYEKGHVGATVSRPSVKYRKEQNEVIVEYRIKELNRAVINLVNIQGVADQELKEKILQIIDLKIGDAFNPILLPPRLKTVQEFLADEGYYNAIIENLGNDDLVNYTADASKVDIVVNINLGKKVYINRVIIIGNIKTQSKLIEREISQKTGEVLLASSLKRSQTNLLSLGLFSNIRFDVEQVNDSKADVYVVVKEKEAGVLEFAPGFRTDLGVKLSSTLSYNNLDGMNKVISLKGQVNHRLNHDTLDERRQKEGRSILEYEASASYSENSIFSSEFDYSTSLSSARKRFYSFDADINRINMTVSRDFTDIFSSSLRYQFETISQTDATNEREAGAFQIGSITPSVTFDFRDSRINPMMGSFFNLSTEFANPTLFSQSNNDLVINYYKIVSRNRFYYPIPNGVLALSVALGMQENLAKGVRADGSSEGYIPNIKVFRLSGIDIVRGYEDDEINRLPSGSDVSEVTVDNKAYMTNIKLEPRFFLTDSTMVGVFYDAGRVFVDEYDFSDLRSSVGLSFKILTPVGSLDIDYGIKLLRKKDNDGNLESPGRLHVSIGFF